MTQRKPILLWLEDSPKTAREVFYFAEDEFIVKQVAQLPEFAEILNDPSHKIKGIILDIMLYDVDDLSDLGIETEVDIDMGANAGWCILEHYLRASDSKFRHIPVLVLSFRSLKKENKKLMERLTRSGGAPITFIEKRRHYDEEGNPITWTERLVSWLNNDAKKRNSP